jgi:hypothetical protein
MSTETKVLLTEAEADAINNGWQYVCGDDAIFCDTDDNGTCAYCDAVYDDDGDLTEWDGNRGAWVSLKH